MRFDISVLTSELTAARRAHCEALVQRMRETHEVDLRFVDAHEPGSFDRAFVDKNIRVEALTDPRLDRFNKYAKTLHLRNVSNAAKHRAALQHVAEQPDAGGADAYLVLEDDALATEGWEGKLLDAVSSRPAGAGFVALGVPTRASGRFQALGDPHEVLPCCDSYLVTPAAARRLVPAFYPLRFVTNVHLTYLLRSLGVDAYLCAANPFLDGSKYGSMISTLNPGNQLILNSTYMGARRRLFDEDCRDAGALREVVDSLHASPFADHPDIMHLRALACWRLKGAAPAAELFRAAMGVYDSNNALVNSESQFLRDYIALHRDLQRAS